MLWGAWRQHRAVLAAAGGIAAALIVGMLLNRPYSGRAAAALLQAGCFAHPHGPGCWGLRFWLASYPDWPTLHGPAALALLMCVFAGAPLLPRGFEQGTHPHDWARAAGPARWIVTQLLALSAAVFVAVVPLALVSSWWITPYEQAGLVSRWRSAGFLLGAPAATAWVIFALSVGILAGAVFRERTRAMVAALVAFGVISVIGARQLPTLLRAVAPAGGGPSFWLAQGLTAACLLAFTAAATAAAIGVTRRRSA
jgi:hypothetical protein